MSIFTKWAVGDGGGIGSLVCAQGNLAPPAAGRVLIRTRAAGLNNRDLSIVAGGYHGRKRFDMVPLSDGCGDVVALGEGVREVCVGERVTAPHFLDWLSGAFSPASFANDLGSTHDGWAAEYISLPAKSLVKVPRFFSDHEAAVFPAAGATAWHALHAFGGLSKDSMVLLLGTGGVSIFGLQLAKMAGARAIVVSTSRRKLDAVRAIGADEVIFTDIAADWSAQVRQATAGRGADIVLETVGNATLGRSIAACAPNGHIALIGALGGTVLAPDISQLIARNVAMKGIASGSRAMLVSLMDEYVRHKVRPVVHELYDFNALPIAYEKLATGQHVGKVSVKYHSV